MRMLVLVVLVLFGTGAADAPAAADARDAPGAAPEVVAKAPGFLLPVPGPAVVLTAFRPPAERWGAGHRGVDLAATVDQPVRAAGAGTVVFAGRFADRGVVSVEHWAGLRTTYEPVTPTVRAGQRVAAGEVIGMLQPGHPSCRPVSCLHWGARVGSDSYLDPMLLLGGWRVRLLPWDGQAPP